MDSWISELESEVHEVEGELEDKVPKLTPGGGVMSTHDLLLSLRALRQKVDPAGPSLPGSGVVSCSRRCVAYSQCTCTLHSVTYPQFTNTRQCVRYRSVHVYTPMR